MEEEFEDTKGVIKIRKSKDDLQNKHIKRLTRNPLKTGGALRCSGRVGSSCTTSGNRFTIELLCATFFLKNLQRV
jgi:hypothetical protein